MTIAVAIVDDEAMVRAGLKMIIESQPDMEVVAEAEDGRAAVIKVQRVRPTVLLIDIRMPGMDGIEATRMISTSTETRVIVLTTFNLDEYVYRALEAGASGFLLKEAPPEQLVAAVRLIAAGDALLAPARTRRLIARHARQVPAALPEPLTARETEMLNLLARGLSNAEIGQAMHVSDATVRTHITHVLSKLGVRSRVQAVIWAYENGMLPQSASGA